MYSKYELAKVYLKSKRVPLFMEYSKTLRKLRVVKRVTSAKYGHDVRASITPRATGLEEYAYVLAPRLNKPKLIR